MCKLKWNNKKYNRIFHTRNHIKLPSTALSQMLFFMVLVGILPLIKREKKSCCCLLQCVILHFRKIASDNSLRMSHTRIYILLVHENKRFVFFLSWTNYELESFVFNETQVRLGFPSQKHSDRNDGPMCDSLHTQ